jgi:hypothetical protein
MKDNKEFADKLRENLKEKQHTMLAKPVKSSSGFIISFLILTSIVLAAFSGFLLYSFLNPTDSKKIENTSSTLSLFPIGSKASESSVATTISQSSIACSGPKIYTNPALPTSFKATIPCTWEIQEDLKPATYYLQSEWPRSYAFSVSKETTTIAYSYRLKSAGTTSTVVNEVFTETLANSTTNKEVRKLGQNAVVTKDGFTFVAPVKNFVFKKDQPEEWAKLYESCIEERQPTPAKIECKNSDTTVFGTSNSNWNVYNDGQNNFMIFYTGDQTREADEIIKNTLF